MFLGVDAGESRSASRPSGLMCGQQENGLKIRDHTSLRRGALTAAGMVKSDPRPSNLDKDARVLAAIKFSREWPGKFEVPV